MNINIDELVAQLESGNPEQAFIAKIASTTEANAPVAAAVTEPAAAVTEPAAVSEDELLRKQAQEAEDSGRIMARGFYDELNKLSALKKEAVGVEGITPNPDAVPANPAVQVASTDGHMADVSKVNSIIQNLTQGTQAHGNNGYIQVNGAPVAQTQPALQDEHPVAVDATRSHMKAASAEAVSFLYSRYFGGQ